jgi:uncharacterized protein (DUF1684 family)
MTTATRQSWTTWHADRVAAATAPDGATALTTTHWITATTPQEAVEVPGAPGRWYIDDAGTVVGTGLPDGWAGPVRLAPGERVSDGDLTLVGHARAGDAALRVFDATSGNRTSVSDIEVFDHDPAWEVTAHFVADPETVTVTSADGFEAPGETAGTLEFTLPDGTGHTLRVNDADGGFFVSFSDAGRVGRHPRLPFPAHSGAGRRREHGDRLQPGGAARVRVLRRLPLPVAVGGERVGRARAGGGAAGCAAQLS